MDNKNNQPVNPEEPKEPKKLTPGVPDRAGDRGTFKRKDTHYFNFTKKDNQERKGGTPKSKDGYHSTAKWGNEGHSKFADWSTDELIKYLDFLKNKPKPEDLEENPEGGYRV